jgi:hypothetical protein
MSRETGGHAGHAHDASSHIAADGKQAGKVRRDETRRRAVSHPVSERQHARRHAHTTETP